MAAKYWLVYFAHFTVLVLVVSSRYFDYDRRNDADDVYQEGMSIEGEHDNAQLYGEMEDTESADKRALRGSRVAFYAYLGKGSISMNNYQRLVFDKVAYNYGSGYNRHTGAFTVPETGIYIFSFHYENWKDSVDQRVHMYVDSTIMASSILNANNRSTQAGNTVVLYVRKGQTVYLKVQTGWVYGSTQERFTVFTGALLN